LTTLQRTYQKPKEYGVLQYSVRVETHSPFVCPTTHGAPT